MDVIYFDNHIIVVNKPAGIPTQPSPHSRESLEDQVKQWAQKQYQKSGPVFLQAVHRLDKPVSGIVLFAKTSKALERLQWLLREKKMTKTYLALIEGTPDQEEGKLVHFLIHDDFRAIVSDRHHPRAKESILHYRLKKKFRHASLVEIQLETGRYHQIRAQFSAIGHPILNDVKYGASFSDPEGRIALHHMELEMIHPVTKEKKVFHQPPPAYWQEWTETKP